ncbi:hypothetical protein NDU88_006805 [Pleurodeles waltl]|uniref:Uncharacterized protein n=1 Tax=Pleurodeles waltl TaxID=8319 RepID=A0AAV7SQV1_PLEWA|nr:hypothetical protein NDU88_006805 [Pleurodeles waltl]
MACVLPSGHYKPHTSGAQTTSMPCKRRHTRDSLGDRQVTKPTSQQAHQGKRAALQAVASLTEARSSEDGQRSEPESLNGEDSTDVESLSSVVEGLPHVTPQKSDDIV